MAVLRIGPGAMTFTVMPCGPSSNAQVRAKPIKPALVAEYTLRVAKPTAAREDNNTTRPNCWACMVGKAACTI